ncbi:PEP-CTERM sorting domain-containing protein [Planctomycetota bacterium]
MKTNKAYVFIAVFLAIVLLTNNICTATIVIQGENMIMDDPRNDFYIPLKLSTSGILGEPTGSGELVGLHSDTVGLTGENLTSSGWVDFTLGFDLSQLSAGENLSLNTILEMTFEDIDFKPSHHSKWVFSETLELSHAGRSSLLIDSSNYGDFTGGFVETNNSSVVYQVALGDIGINENEIQSIHTEGRLDLGVRFGSFITATEQVYLSNTPERLSVNFELLPIQKTPEPATIFLLGLGTMMLRRKRS